MGALRSSRRLSGYESQWEQCAAHFLRALAGLQRAFESGYTACPGLPSFAGYTELGPTRAQASPQENEYQPNLAIGYMCQTRVHVGVLYPPFSFNSLHVLGLK